MADNANAVVCSEAVSNALETMLMNIARRPERVNVYTPPERPKAVVTILKGIADWLTDEPTIEALIVEDLARAIEKCSDREELRDLSVQVRAMAFSFQPDASRVALTPAEAQLLNTLDRALNN